MNRNQLRALAADAFHQVLDNGVFRILAILCALPVLFTFVVGIREEGVVLLFGVKSWTYKEIFGAFTPGALPPDPRGMLIEILLQIVLDFLAGSLGMLMALSATSFFVPRLLEKGAAELYFHKPVSRTVLLVSRYFAGLVFVGLISLVLVGGIYLGLLLVSGHGDPAILLAAPILTYTFVPIYAFTVLAGVVTRSSVASLLLSAFFFLFNGCIQQSWIAWQAATKGPAQRLVHEADEESDAPAGKVAEDGDTEEDEDDEDEGKNPAAQFFLNVLDGLHLVLPKTADADAFGQKLRKALDRPLYRDEEALVALARLPAGLEPLELDEIPPDAPLRARLGVPVLAARAGNGTVHSLCRRPAEHTETTIGERVKKRVETASQAAKSLEKDLKALADVRAVERGSERFGSTHGEGEISGSLVTWYEGEGDGTRTRSALVFKGTRDDPVFTLFCDAQGELASEAAAEERKRLAGELYVDRMALEDWYPGALGFGAPLRFNILFSIGSTLAFAALMLALGVWRLARIGF